MNLKDAACEKQNARDLIYKFCVRLNKVFRLIFFQVFYLKIVHTKIKWICVSDTQHSKLNIELDCIYFKIQLM